MSPERHRKKCVTATDGRKDGHQCEPAASTSRTGRWNRSPRWAATTAGEGLIEAGTWNVDPSATPSRSAPLIQTSADHYAANGGLSEAARRPT